jgi:SAM-dependent methyltransferase
MLNNDPGQSEFDRFSEGYVEILDASLAFSGYDSTYFDQFKVREMYRIIRKTGRADQPLKILNFGCGIGKCERFIAHYFPNSSIYSTDISSESIRISKERNSALRNVTFAVSDGITIPFQDSFDIIFCAGVFHHIPKENRHSILVGLSEKLSPDGKFFLFEHNPWNPLTRRIVASCQIDKNANLISMPALKKMLLHAGFTHITGHFIVFFPRWFSFLTPLERFMGAFPIGAQYYLLASRDAPHQEKK